MNVGTKEKPLLLIYIALLSVTFRCLHGETRVKVKVMMKEYHVNGRDWDGKKCDYVVRTECDPMFLMCIDKPNSDSNPSNCAYTQKGWSDHYQSHNNIYFGTKIGKSVDNPISTTINDFSGSFKFKVHVRDHDSGSGHDDIDKFNYNFQATPAKSSATARWHYPPDIYGTRPRDQSRLKIEVLLYCEADWFTDDCSVYCKAHDDDVNGHYTCDSDTGKKVCRTGWETPEENCLVKIDDCENHDCVNGATCVDAYKTYTCDCMPGYAGDRCEVNVDECASNPCRNGGECLDQIDYFHCDCSDPYTGKFCEHHVCSVEDYCENGGTCFDDGLGNVSCICMHPFIGRHCDVDRCDVLKCENGGTCINGSCVCPPGYMGNLCEFMFCDKIVCENGGTCENDACVCTPGYTGRYCHIYINFCEDEPCENDGTCRDHVNGYTCRCLPDFNGTHCEIKIPPSWEDDEKALGQVATSIACEGPAGWAIGVIMAVIAFVILLVIAIAIYLRRRRRRRKAAEHSPPTITSESDTQSSFPNPLYNTDLGNSESIQAAAARSCSIETTCEKVPFPDADKTMSPPPPYTFREEFQGDFKDPEYAELGPKNPPVYSEVGMSASALPSYRDVGVGATSHYDNPRSLQGGQNPHYDNPKKLKNNNEPIYEVPKALKSKGIDTEKDQDLSQRLASDDGRIDEMRNMASLMDDSVHNNSTNEMLERDNEAYEEN